MGKIFLIDKPKGMSSFRALKIFQKKIGANKIGHAGTLDPNASGLLIAATDEMTKELGAYVGLPKKYEAEILFGVRTDTGDTAGVVLEEVNIVPEEKSVRAALPGMVGELILPVSLFSAMKRGGKPLYSYARKGEKIIQPKRGMEVKEAELVSFEPPYAKIIFSVGSGTYVRSLAEELGKRLETVATLSELRRLSVGDFKVEDAEKLAADN